MSGRGTVGAGVGVDEGHFGQTVQGGVVDDDPVLDQAVVAVVGEAVQLTLDIDHWNSVNLDKAPIVMPMDFTDDVEERLCGPDDEEAVA